MVLEQSPPPKKKHQTDQVEKEYSTTTMRPKMGMNVLGATILDQSENYRRQN